MARPGTDATRKLVAEKGDVEPEQLPARRVAHVHAHTRVLHHNPCVLPDLEEQVDELQREPSTKSIQNIASDLKWRTLLDCEAEVVSDSTLA